MFFLLAGATVISVTTWRFRADYSWNSWDIITDPKGITHYTVQYTRDSSLQSIGFTGLIAIFFLYFMHYTLHLQPPPAQEAEERIAQLVGAPPIGDNHEQTRHPDPLQIQPMVNG